MEAKQQPPLQNVTPKTPPEQQKHCRNIQDPLKATNCQIFRSVEFAGVTNSSITGSQQPPLELAANNRTRPKVNAHIANHHHQAIAESASKQPNTTVNNKIEQEKLENTAISCT
ncbi:hypothetical protein TSUD_42950 [Trifolium subterraneum]|uniref:Uncharacterized protein n=1 Tax=Trifolium subterraneum TaxID=3900 RepID=A0A2Z6MEL4_TRISU|nr:hypothetical protein TSUD_42950 [Trifolium subterraneum]